MKAPILPAPLRPGDKIALITPATVVREEYVAAGEAEIRRRGYMPVRMSHLTTGGDGRFASSATHRLEDLLAALQDPAIRAIWCCRGGYGSVQMISQVPLSTVQMSAKWLIGFSDVCALHSLWLRTGVKALHAPMMRRLKDRPTDEISDLIFAILGGATHTSFSGAIHPLQQCGTASGRLIGGNVSVLGDLAATPFDQAMLMADEPFILMLEDVGESLSRLQRRLWRLRRGNKPRKRHRGGSVRGLRQRGELHLCRGYDCRVAGRMEHFLSRNVQLSRGPRRLQRASDDWRPNYPAG